MGYYPILDRAPKGRDEDDGFQLWIRRHDEYEQPLNGPRPLLPRDSVYDAFSWWRRPARGRLAQQMRYLGPVRSIPEWLESRPV